MAKARSLPVLYPSDTSRAASAGRPPGLAEEAQEAGPDNPLHPSPVDHRRAGRGLDEPCDLCVVGLGYIGLPTAALFADAGLSVTGVDRDPDRVEAVNAARTPLDEPGLDVILARAVASGRLLARGAPVRARAFLIAVPTPLKPGKTPDLSHVHEAVEDLAPFLGAGDLVILESTVPVGATRDLAAALARRRPDLSFPGQGESAVDVHVAHCPERVLPGWIIEELLGNDRVIGGLTPGCAIAAARFYSRVVRGRCHLTDAATAEMTKLAENSFRDVNIAFANELDAIAEIHGIDARAVIALANRHPRVSILDPGPGVGGHCIAVDPWFLSASAPTVSRLIPIARAINDSRPAGVAARVTEMIRDLPDPTIACLGLAYKRDVGDLRESPALEVARRLAGSPAGTLLVVEPHIDRLPEVLEGAMLVTASEALLRADMLVLLVDHTEFRDLPVDAIYGLRVLDTRGMWILPDMPAGRHRSTDRPARRKADARPASRTGPAAHRTTAAPITGA